MHVELAFPIALDRSLSRSLHALLSLSLSLSSILRFCLARRAKRRPSGWINRRLNYQQWTVLSTDSLASASRRQSHFPRFLSFLFFFFFLFCYQNRRCKAESIVETLSLFLKFFECWQNSDFGKEVGELNKISLSLSLSLSLFLSVFCAL